MPSSIAMADIVRSLCVTSFTVSALNSSVNRLRLLFLVILNSPWKTSFLWGVHFSVQGQWAIALFLHPALIAIAYATDIALGGALPAVKVQFSSAFGILSLLAFVFLFGPVPEEIGWRGFALDRLQNRMTALHASLVLGSAWALWHVPLFLIPGTFQADIGLGSARSWVLLSSMLPLSILMTWIYNNTGRSTLSAMLVHFSGNLCGALLAKSTIVAAVELLLLSLAAVLVTGVWGARHLTRR
ncbi:MAG: type II CAAX prenyl endopeptidase Rce1 family protein [Myxococcota bacterium]